MHTARPLFFTLLLLAMTAPAAFCQTPQVAPVPATEQTTSPAFALKDGDRVVFYGDSITEQRMYTQDVEDFVITRYPTRDILFFNAGVGGDTVSGGWAGDMATRVDRDVLPYRPTVVTLMLGMNDGHYTTAPDETSEDRDAYTTGYKKLLGRIQAGLPGVRITLIAPSPYDEISRPSDVPGYNNVLLRYGQFVAETARQQGMQVADFNRPMTQVLQAGMRVNPSLASLLVPDHVHPSAAGHWAMAAALMRAWNVSPIVSSVSLDGGKAALLNAQNTTVSYLMKTATGVRWDQQDQALPLPLALTDPMIQFLLKISDLASVDQQVLRVQGLSASSYTLTIDHQKVASFTRQELADGVNLALYATPMLRQAQHVDALAGTRSTLSRTHFFLITTKLQSPDVAAAAETIQAMESEVAAEQHTAAQPKLHGFELTAN
ncbi:MAG: SGNH/GDSL hydrolase family protein [Acidobacteriaceae bacterium]